MELNHVKLCDTIISISVSDYKFFSSNFPDKQHILVQIGHPSLRSKEPPRTRNGEGRHCGSSPMGRVGEDSRSGREDPHRD